MTDGKPFLWDRRDAPGLLGVVARWWGPRKVARIKRAQRRVSERKAKP